jgi:hypothetical protein
MHAYAGKIVTSKNTVLWGHKRGLWKKKSPKSRQLPLQLKTGNGGLPNC